MRHEEGLRRTVRRYGLTIHQFYALFNSQGGVCAICGGTDNRRLNLDHDHKTGEIRGLLCSGCNGAMLGRLEHVPGRMEQRAESLESRARAIRAGIQYLANPPAQAVL